MSRIIAVLLGLAVIAGVIIGVTRMKSHNQTTSSNPNQPASHPAELQIQDEVAGSGAAAETGKTVSVNYLGTLTNGSKFDSSYDRNQPFSFTLGQHQVIEGWEQGIVGMKVGGKRKLTIPPELGYGSQSPSPAIPPNSTLVFEVELLDVK